MLLWQAYTLNKQVNVNNNNNDDDDDDEHNLLLNERLRRLYLDWQFRSLCA
jgi:hypothetical protein